MIEEKENCSIKPLIDAHCGYVSILEDTRDVALWLKQVGYLVVVDEDLEIAGIIVPADLNDPLSRQIIDIDIKKPKIQPAQSLASVTCIMLENNQPHLPVYDHEDFLGVISLVRIQAISPPAGNK